MKDMEYRFNTTKNIFRIVYVLAFLGGASGIIALALGKIETGSTIILATITGVLGFLGGRATVPK